MSKYSVKRIKKSKEIEVSWDTTDNPFGYSPVVICPKCGGADPMFSGFKCDLCDGDGYVKIISCVPDHSMEDFIKEIKTRRKDRRMR